MCLAASSRSTSWRQRELCVSFPAQSRSRTVHAALEPQLQPDLGQVGASAEWVGELCAADIEPQRELAAEGALCELPSTAQENCARSCGRCAGWGKWEPRREDGPREPSERRSAPRTSCARSQARCPGEQRAVFSPLRRGMRPGQECKTTQPDSLISTIWSKDHTT